MMSGDINWINGSFWGKGTDGHFWVSAPSQYIGSRFLGFNSANVYPKTNGNNKPSGFPLRCVVQLFAPFLPELSAAFLFRLCYRAVSTGSLVVSTIEVQTGSSGHLRSSPILTHGA